MMRFGAFDFHVDGDAEQHASRIMKTKRGIGMIPPFYAETASTKNNQDWPFWIVRNSRCNSTGEFYSRALAERLAAAMNARA